MGPPEPRRLRIVLSAAEAVLALVFAWALARSGFARHASRWAHVEAAEIVILAATLGCLALYVFVLAFWQWRLSGRARIRLLLAIFLSLAVGFCSFCWYDVSVRMAELNHAHGHASPLAELREQTAAVLLSLGALALGLSAVAVILWLERRSRRSRNS